MSVAPKLSAYAGFGGSAVLLGIAFGSPTLVALGAPFAVYLAFAFAIAEQPELELAFRLDTERAVEGEEIVATLTLESSSEVPEVEILMALPPAITCLDAPLRQVLSLQPGEPRILSLTLRAERWGVYELGEIAVRVRDRFGLLACDRIIEPTRSLRVYPGYERLQALIAPFETDPHAGGQVSRVKGDGIEFADIRPFVSGDYVRRVNWRRSARGQTLYVNESRPERNSDVVLFLDSFSDASHDNHGTLDLTVRAAGALAREYLKQRDRVGIVSFGGIVRWLVPAMGKTQIYRIIDALLETQVLVSYAWKGIEVLPPRSLPPRALIVALTPLLDERSAAALIDLRSRGFDLVVFDISPLPFITPPHQGVEALALRLWPLWRETLRFRYEQLGVVVVEWTADKPLMQLLEEARRLRRYAHRVRA